MESHKKVPSADSAERVRHNQSVWRSSASTVSPVAGLTMQQLRVQMEFNIYQNKKWLQCTNTQQADWRLSILIQPINDYCTYNVLIIVHH